MLLLLLQPPSLERLAGRGASVKCADVAEEEHAAPPASPSSTGRRHEGVLPEKEAVCCGWVMGRRTWHCKQASTTTTQQAAAPGRAAAVGCSR